MVHAALVILTALWCWSAWRYHFSRKHGYTDFDAFMSGGFRLHLAGVSLAAFWLVVLIR